jgi:dihydroflavonol-4-reductase
MYRANVDGTRNVIRAAQARGVRRIVYTSSAIVLGEEKGTVGSETSPHRGRHLSHYERSKFEAERVAFAEARDVELVVVNPSSVQGPGRATGTGGLILDVVNGKLPLMVDSTLSVIDIDDCARGHTLAEERGEPGRRYVLNGFSVSVREAR